MISLSVRIPVRALAFSLYLGALAVTSAVGQESQGTGLAKQVDQIFAEWDRTDSPGCALGVISDGQFTYRRGYGMANLEYDVPLSSESVFYIGSTSKQFVAASIMLAAEQGHLSLEDDIRKYVPEIPDYGMTLTVRHLLHHTSGLRDYLTLWNLAGENIEDIHTPDDALQMIARQKSLNFEPGDEYLYSN
jgi:CubicO group peptidase (beta-lactamase class C family)